MLNPFVWKKYGALIVAQAVTTCTFAVVAIFYGMLWGVAAYIITMMLMTWLAGLMLYNPFTAMLEGKGLLVLDINSSGIIRPFIVALEAPYIKGKVGNSKVKDIFDRASIFQFAKPTQNGTPIKFEDKTVGDKKETNIIIKLDEDQYNKGRFALFHYPVIIWNDQIKTIITKDMLAETEKDVFAEHTVLYLNRIMEDLSSMVRDFGRYIVELTRPKDSWSGNWWVWVLIIGGIILLAVIFGPTILNTVKGTMGTATQTVANVGGAVVTPR